MPTAPQGGTSSSFICFVVPCSQAWEVMQPVPAAMPKAAMKARTSGERACGILEPRRGRPAERHFRRLFSDAHEARGLTRPRQRIHARRSARVEAPRVVLQERSRLVVLVKAVAVVVGVARL